MTDDAILLFGANGQVGREVLHRAERQGRRVIALYRSDVDISDAESVGRAVTRHCPSVIINAAAYTAVDAAESERAQAFAVNHLGAAHIAAAAARQGAAVIHISTDYVFDGTKKDAYTEADQTRPLGVYGRSKMAGETAVAVHCGRHLILRTAWVFSAQGSNFAKTMFRLMQQERRPKLRVVADQIGCPTPARDIAAACLALAARAGEPASGLVWGTYHFAGSEPVSWYGFATAIAEGLKKRCGTATDVEAITTADYPTPAARPANSVLDCSRIGECLGIAAPDWRAGLDEVLDELVAQHQVAEAAAP
jgi:dTDP-4-dehydrorhamnose reductase